MKTSAWQTLGTGWGVFSGPLLLMCWQLAIDCGERSLNHVAPGQTSSYLATSWRSVLWLSFLPGAVLGGLSIAVWNGWITRDERRTQLAAAGVLCYLVGSGIWTLYKIVFSIYLLPPYIVPGATSGMHLSFLRTITAHLTMIANDAELQWAILLIIIGKLAMNSIAYEQRRTHRTPAPVGNGTPVSTVP